jgi:polyphosphate kinase 2 (PPK2 family)
MNTKRNTKKRKERKMRRNWILFMNTMRYLTIIEKVLEKTDIPHASSTIVKANDRNFATLKIITTATQAIETYIEHMTLTQGQQTIKYRDR